MIKATKIYARFASETYDDFGETDFKQEYYRKEHADEELRTPAEWVKIWKNVQAKCREKAKEYK